MALHCFFPELLPEIFGHLANIPVPFDLLVTNASGTDIDCETLRPAKAVSVRVFDVDNHGRDILPTIYLANAGAQPLELVLKVHTKKSEWRSVHGLAGTGTEWRTGLLDQLVGSESGVIGILDAFAASPHLGVVTADGSVLGPEQWGDNQPTARTLLRRIELGLHESSCGSQPGRCTGSGDLCFRGCARST